KEHPLISICRPFAERRSECARPNTAHAAVPRDGRAMASDIAEAQINEQGVDLGPLGERVTGIEPAWPAWKAGALPLSYTREVTRCDPRHYLAASLAGVSERRCAVDGEREIVLVAVPPV